LHQGADARGDCGAVCRGPFWYEVLRGDFWGSGDQRNIVSGEPVCAAGSGADWSRNREYPLLSRVAGGTRAANGGGGCAAVGDRGHPQQTAPCGNIRSTRGVTPTPSSPLADVEWRAAAQLAVCLR